MIKLRAVKIAIAASLLASLFTHIASADPDHDFSNVDCNDEKIRGLLLETYNEIKSNSDSPTVIDTYDPVSYTHLRAHETRGNLVCRLLLEKKK